MLKEYGSWSILIISWMIGIAVSRKFNWSALVLLASLALLINSKQAVVKRLSSPSDRTAILLFTVQAGVAVTVLVTLFGSGIVMLLPFLVFPVGYLASLRYAGDHALLTETLGFILLSLAAVLAKFLLTGGLDIRLVAGVAFYFTAGVFKVKTLLLRRTKDRILIIAHALCAVYVYHRMHIPLIILLPLLDNVIVAVYPYKARLKTAGWIELAKSLAVLALFMRYY